MSLFFEGQNHRKNASLLSPKVIWIFSLLVSFILSSHSKTQMEDRLIIIIILILKVLFYNCRVFKYENEVFTFKFYKLKFVIYKLKVDWFHFIPFCR